MNPFTLAEAFEEVLSLEFIIMLAVLIVGYFVISSAVTFFKYLKSNYRKVKSTKHFKEIKLDEK